MSVYHRLRQRNPGKTALEALCNRCAGSEIAQVRAGERYLQLQLHDELGNQGHAWLNVDDWLQKMARQLPGVPWLEVPLSYLVRWLNTLTLSFLLQDKVWDVVHIALPRGGCQTDGFHCLPGRPHCYALTGQKKKMMRAEGRGYSSGICLSACAMCLDTASWHFLNLAAFAAET